MELEIPKKLSGKYLEAYLEIGRVLISDKNIIGAILSGSILTDEYGKTSDLDIIAITKKDVRQRKQISIKGVFTELFFYSKNELYKSFEEGDYQDMNMMGNGFIMFSKNKIIGDVRKKAKSLFDKGPEKLNEEQKTYLKYLVWDSYCDVLDILEKDPIMAFSLMQKNVWYALEVFYKINSIWFCKSKKMLPEIKNINQEMYNNLIEFYSYSYKDNEKVFNAFRSIIEAIICPHNIDEHFVWESKPRKGRLKA